LLSPLPCCSEVPFFFVLAFFARLRCPFASLVVFFFGAFCTSLSLEPAYPMPPGSSRSLPEFAPCCSSKSGSCFRLGPSPRSSFHTPFPFRPPRPLPLGCPASRPFSRNLNARRMFLESPFPKSPFSSSASPQYPFGVTPSFLLIDLPINPIRPPRILTKSAPKQLACPLLPLVVPFFFPTLQCRTRAAFPPDFETYLFFLQRASRVRCSSLFSHHFNPVYRRFEVTISPSPRRRSLAVPPPF